MSRRSGKSWAATHALFNNWLVTNFNPLPESGVQLLMWDAWLKSYQIMQNINIPRDKEEVHIYWEELNK